MRLTRSDFGTDFHWGVAVAAYQIEGGWNADGKGPSIWDDFVHRPRKIDRRETGDIACDFYHRYLEDIQLLKDLHIPAFRFSISWPRLFPAGRGQPNPAGVAFYHQVIDALLAVGIEPWVTLYHWDLPLTLQTEYGGWTNRKILDDFLAYATFCAKEYGRKVRYWMVLNEPLAFTAVGYLLGVHAPGLRGLKPFFSRCPPCRPRPGREHQAPQSPPTQHGPGRNDLLYLADLPLSPGELEGPGCRPPL